MFSPATKLQALRRAASVLLALACCPAGLAAQADDQGTLVLQVAGREAGIESFRISHGTNGVRVTGHARFGDPRRGVVLTATVERGPSGDLAFQLERRAGVGSGQVYAVERRNRITIRRVGRGAEQATELPTAPGLVFLADSVLATYVSIVPLATESGRLLTGVFPETGRRTRFTATRQAGSHGTVVRLTGGLEGEIGLGNAGEVLRISIPGIGLVGVRQRP